MEETAKNKDPKNELKPTGLLLLAYMVLAPLMVLFVVFFAGLDLASTLFAGFLIGTGLIAVALLNLFLYRKEAGKQVKK